MGSERGMTSEGDELLDHNDESEYVDTTTTQAFGFIPVITPENKQRTAALIVLSGRSSGRSFTLGSDESSSVALLSPPFVSMTTVCHHAKGDPQRWAVDHHGPQLDQRNPITTASASGPDPLRRRQNQLGIGDDPRFQHQDVLDERFQQQMYESRLRIH
jgi:hypothetical protein